MNLDLFPETTDEAGVIPDQPVWRGQLLDQYGHHRLEVHLLPAWRPELGLYVCGWYAQVNRCIDEWHPGMPLRHRSWPTYPWHRTDDMPSGRCLNIAKANALRGVNIVLAQMAAHEGADDAVCAEVAALVVDLASLTQQWLKE